MIDLLQDAPVRCVWPYDDMMFDVINIWKKINVNSINDFRVLNDQFDTKSAAQKWRATGPLLSLAVTTVIASGLGWVLGCCVASVSNKAHLIYSKPGRHLWQQRENKQYKRVRARESNSRHWTLGDWVRASSDPR